MNTARLLRAIEIMREVEAEELPFDMNNWISHFEEGSAPPFGNRETTCGTAACMLGWCAMDPDFQKEGLQFYVNFYKVDGEYEDEKKLINPTISEQNRLIHEEGWQFDDANVAFNGEHGCDAAAEFFDISAAAAEYLTVPSCYPSRGVSPAMVIQHIEDVLNGTFKEPKDEEGDFNEEVFSNDQEDFNEEVFDNDQIDDETPAP